MDGRARGPAVGRLGGWAGGRAAGRACVGGCAGRWAVGRRRLGGRAVGLAGGWLACRLACGLAGGRAVWVPGGCQPHGLAGGGAGGRAGGGAWAAGLPAVFGVSWGPGRGSSAFWGGAGGPRGGASVFVGLTRPWLAAVVPPRPPPLSPSPVRSFSAILGFWRIGVVCSVSPVSIFNNGGVEASLDPLPLQKYLGSLPRGRGGLF